MQWRNSVQEKFEKFPIICSTTCLSKATADSHHSLNGLLAFKCNRKPLSPSWTSRGPRLSVGRPPLGIAGQIINTAKGTA